MLKWEFLFFNTPKFYYYRIYYWNCAYRKVHITKEYFTRRQFDFFISVIYSEILFRVFHFRFYSQRKHDKTKIKRDLQDSADIFDVHHCSWCVNGPSWNDFEVLWFRNFWFTSCIIWDFEKIFILLCDFLVKGNPGVKSTGVHFGIF